MEAMIYEVRPWAFVAIGAYCMFNSSRVPESHVLFFSGAMLAAAAGMIIYARSQNRNRSYRK